MSLLAESVLFDSVNQLLHLPETLERLGSSTPPPAKETRRSGGGGGGAGGEEKGWGSVAVDILEREKDYTFFLDVPGVPKADIQVTLEDEKVLVIRSSGKRKREESEEERSCKYLRLERKASPKFVRKFRLPDDANTSAVTAKCENGVLTVVVEKLPPPPEAKPKTVQVAVA